MRQVLTQDEINALLAAVGESSDGELAKKTLEGAAGRRHADLAGPARMLRPRLPALEAAHLAFCRDVRRTRADAGAGRVALEPVAVRTLTFGEFRDGLPATMAIAPFHAAPLPGLAALLLDGESAYALIGATHGGPGEPYRAGDRDFTTIQRGVLEKFVADALAAFARAMAPFAELRPAALGLAADPRFLSLAHPAEFVVVLESRLDLGDVHGPLLLALPWAMLAPLRARLAPDGLAPAVAADERWRAALAATIVDARVEVVARLGRLELTVGELLDLRPGQVLALDALPGAAASATPALPLEIAVEEIVKFRAAAELDAGRRVVRIL